jgi:dihydropteroate synthase
MRGTPQTMQNFTDYKDLKAEIMTYFSKKLQELKILGVNDVIIDPGFGFAKSLEQNYELLHGMGELGVFNCPVLVGISRKSMINKVLNTSALEALNGTTVLNTIALLNGAQFLRVHDVKPAKEAIKLVEAYKGGNP